MNLDEIIKSIRASATELYPDEPKVSELCEALITCERENISKTTHRYKEQYRKILDGLTKSILKD
jgi:hypothetical protein